MSIDLDPREVLKYLNQLGYCNITKEQLKEFIYDLKKLVKYDDAKINDCEDPPQNNLRPKPSSTNAKNRPGVRSTGNADMGLGLGGGSETFGNLVAPCNTSDSAVSLSYAFDKENVRSWKQQGNNQASTRPRPTTINSSTDSTSESLSSSSNRSSTCSSLDLSNHDTKLTEGSLGSATSKHTRATTKSTSFIRPWRLLAPVKSVPNQRRTDPVSLYHHYQSIWNRQKMPGEDNHADLRWSIREKMLGQDPHPRPVSRASSVEHMKRHLESKK